MEKLKILGSVTSEVMLGSTTVPVTFLVTEEFIAPALLGNRELTKFNVSINLLNKLLFVGENQEPVPFSLDTATPLGSVGPDGVAVLASTITVPPRSARFVAFHCEKVDPDAPYALIEPVPTLDQKRVYVPRHFENIYNNIIVVKLLNPLPTKQVLPEHTPDRKSVV